MTVHERRLPPFAWLGLDALKRLRETLPPQRQQGARNALVGLAEAASLRHDGQHREGDTLRELSALTGVSERRLRDHLAELENVGLVRIERPTDHAGRDLPARYYLIDPGSDESSDRADGCDDKSSAKPSDPTRARVRAQNTEDQKPPLPPAGGRARDRARYQEQLDAWIARELPTVYEHPQGLTAVRQALRNDDGEHGRATDLDGVVGFLRRWWPQLPLPPGEAPQLALDGATGDDRNERILNGR